jgi:carbon-monoxide dehydrogenase medium subunit
VVDAVRHVADPWLRRRGTIGGTMAHAAPNAELGVALVALDGLLRIGSARGERVLNAEEFFVGRHLTALTPDELLLEVSLPAPAGRWGFGFEEVSRRYGLAAVVAVGVGLGLGDDGVITGARVAVGGVAEAPVRLAELERALVGAVPGEAVFADVAGEAGALLEPPSDTLASGTYRRNVVPVLLRRGLETAMARLEGRR